ncbi:MAG: YedE family putative selenium transporter [Eubacteriales bacterium]
MKKLNWKMLGAGGFIGLVAIILTAFGNPANMGFCIACFLRDISGALSLHNAAVVQYIRPEIIGLILGAFIVSLITKEFRPKAGSAPAIRFFLGAMVMIGALAFLGCPARLILRLAGGDYTAIAGLLGYVGGIAVGVFALNKGFTLGRAYDTKKAEGYVMPAFAVALLVLLCFAPAFIIFSVSGPGSLHAPIALALGGGLAVGVVMQRSRFCTVGGVRDIMVFKDFNLFYGLIGFFLVALVGNLVLNNFNPTLEVQPIAHKDYLWSFLGMALVGWGSVLLGGCPMRQLILAGSGNGDSAVTVLGMIVGAAFAHNWGLAGGADSLVDGVYTAGGVSTNGEIAIVICLVLTGIITVYNIQRGKKQ